VWLLPVARAPPDVTPRTPICHSEGAHPGTLPYHRIRRATEESTFRFLVACRDTPNRPCLAVSPPKRSCGLPRPASPEPTVDSSALQPSAHSSGPSAAGPRNDSSRFKSAGVQYAAHSGSHWTHPHLSFRGSAPGTLPYHRTGRATEESTVRFLVAGRGTPNQPCLAVSPPQHWRGAAASGLARADSRFLGPATCGASVRLQCGRASE
jgi:hypothetical protein